MKRTGIGLSVVTGVLLCSWFAIAWAQRGSDAPTPIGPAPVGQALHAPAAPTQRMTSPPQSAASDPFAQNPAWPQRSEARFAEPGQFTNPTEARPLTSNATAQRYPAPDDSSRYVTAQDVPAMLASGQSTEREPIVQAGPAFLPSSEPTLAPPPRGYDDRYDRAAPAALPSPAPSGAAPAAYASDNNEIPFAQAPAPLAPPVGSAYDPASNFTEPGPPQATLSPPQSFAPTMNAQPLAGPTPTAAAPRSAGTGRPGNKQLEGPQSPALNLEKLAPTEIQVGKVTKFTLVVRNVGNVTAHDVEVQDDVPAGTELVSTSPRAERGPRGELLWNLGSLKPNDEAAIEVELLPVAEGEIGSVATLHFAAQSSSRSICTRPELVLDVSAPREVLIGEMASFSIRVSNPGTGIATGILLSELVPAQLEHPAGAELEYELGDLKPGETRELELTMKAVKAGTILNRLTAKGDGQLQAVKESTLTVVAPGLEVTLEGPRRRFLDRQAVYTLAISNPGTAAARDVALTTYLPAGLEFVEANNAGQYDPRTRTVQWLLDELPPQEVGKVTLTALPVEAGDLPLKIASTAQRGLNLEKQEIIRVEGVSALVFQVIDLHDPVEIGGETVYEVQVANQGSKAAENVQVVAQFPPELKPVAAEGPARFEIVGQQVVFQPLPRLAPKSEGIYRIRAHALRAGDVKVGVQLRSSDLTTPVIKEEGTRVFGDQ